MTIDLSDLARTIATLAEAVDGAASSLAAANANGEDIALVAEQSKRARDTVSELERALAASAHEEQFVLLHRLNNQLTGILSLTMLQLDDLGSAHVAAPSLERIDAMSREAAAVVKKISTALKSAR